MVNTGTRVYTFNTADAAKTVLISYEYTAVSTTARVAASGWPILVRRWKPSRVRKRASASSW
jgi:hypothetical protein